MASGELGLGIEQVHLRWATVLKELDDRSRSGLEMSRMGRKTLRLRGVLPVFGLKKACQGKGAEAESGCLQDFSTS